MNKIDGIKDIEGIKGGKVFDIWNASVTDDEIIAFTILKGNDVFHFNVAAKDIEVEQYALCKECGCQTNTLSAFHCLQCGSKLPERPEQE